LKLTSAQDYQRDIFNELIGNDELVVLAHGLGLLRIITNVLHSHDVAGNNLIVLVGADERDNELISEALVEQCKITRSPKSRGVTSVRTDVANVGAREEMYARGGILTITSRILVVDLLSKLLDPGSIAGMILLHAERVIATSLEAFIVRLYRQQNKGGFFKAFSDNPEPFTNGFAPLATSLRNLFLQKSSIWPRFQLTVVQSLEGRKKAEVVEFEVPMTDNMRDIQNAVLECVEVSISELRKAGTGIELDDWTVDSALHRSFDVIVRRQLDAVWHRVSFRTRQLVNDLTVLRGILQ
jgi:DNA excision repair protein ERCC-4